MHKTFRLNLTAQQERWFVRLLSGLGFKGEGYGKETWTQMQLLKDKRQD